MEAVSSLTEAAFTHAAPEVARESPAAVLHAARAAAAAATAVRLCTPPPLTAPLRRRARF